MSAPTLPAVLLVDDSEDDVFFMLRAVKEAGIKSTIHVVRDGRAAQDYLAGTGKYADRGHYPLPKLMLLDLKLPYLSGLELLQWLRAQAAELGQIVVIVLTSSQAPVDLNRAFQLGANSVLEKPPTPEKIRDLVRLFRL